MALTTKRIIALPSQTDPQEGDYLAIDNAQGGTHKIPVGRIGVEVDDTLTEQGKAADAKATGDALDEIRSQIEVTGTASGAIATFSDGADMPAKSVIVNIEPQQSGSGTPSPDNVRPISGWESVVTSVSGKNLFNSNADDYSRPVDYFICPIKLKMDTRYTVSIRLKSGGTAQSGFTVGIAKHGSKYQEFGSFVTIAKTSTQLPTTIRFTTNSEYDDPKIILYTTPLSSQGVADWFANYEVQLEEGTTATTYEPYNGTTTTVNLGRTVYGGEAEIVGGSLTDKMVMVTFNGTENWYSVDTSGTDRNRALYADIDSPTGQYNLNLIGNYITPTEQADSYPQLWKANINAAGNLLIGIPKTITTIAEWKAYLAQNPLQLCYELATPQTYQLTPTEVKTLLGENNVWADSGDISVTYVRDLNIAINNLIGE